MYSTNEDDFTAVDLASMLNQTAIVRMLLSRGAKDSAKCELAGSLAVTPRPRAQEHKVF